MTGHECYHCKQWVAEGETHDCWTTTDAALTKDLSEDLQDAYERLREAAVDFGEQRIYASHHSIMFARKSCYFFVRPKRNFLEVVIFLGRAVTSPRVKKIHESSRVKRAHVIHVKHRDEVEAPLTDWLLEAYDFEHTKLVKTKGQLKSTKKAAKTTTSARGKPRAAKKAKTKRQRKG